MYPLRLDKKNGIEQGEQTGRKKDEGEPVKLVKKR
jgi:hypothetical protein